MDTQRTDRGHARAGIAPLSDWKLIASWVVITTLGWTLMLALLIAAFWLLE